MSRNKWFIIGFLAAVATFFVARYLEAPPPMTPAQERVATVAAVARDYHRTHACNDTDFPVCVDMAIDLWNQLQTEGINCEIKVGSLNKELGLLKNDPLNFIRGLDHVWILFEVEKDRFLPLETTGCSMVFGDNKDYDKYFVGFSFDNPKEFKRFLDARENCFRVCGQVEKLVTHYNQTYAGRLVSHTSLEAKGMVQVKDSECNNAMEELVNSIVRR